MRVIIKQTKIQSIAVGHLRVFEEMNQAFDRYQIKPVIEKVYPFEEALQAYEHLAKEPFVKS